MKVPFLDLKLQHQAIRTEVLAALADTYDNTRFCLGRDVEDFEKAFSATLGYPRTLGMNSGTSPLHIASIAGGFGPGDEIITTPFTFASSCWGISYVGAKPVFVDIDADTWCISPEAIAKAITPKTKGIVVVHIFGQPARMDEIMAIAKAHKLFVVEDCAQAVGASYKGAPVGGIGDCGTFSFYPDQEPRRLRRRRGVCLEAPGGHGPGPAAARARLAQALHAHRGRLQLPHGRLPGRGAQHQAEEARRLDRPPPRHRRDVSRRHQTLRRAAAGRAGLRRVRVAPVHAVAPEARRVCACTWKRTASAPRSSIPARCTGSRVMPRSVMPRAACRSRRRPARPASACRSSPS